VGLTVTVVILSGQSFLMSLFVQVRVCRINRASWHCSLLAWSWPSTCLVIQILR